MDQREAQLGIFTGAGHARRDGSLGFKKRRQLQHELALDDKTAFGMDPYGLVLFTALIGDCEARRVERSERA